MTKIKHLLTADKIPANNLENYIYRPVSLGKFFKERYWNPEKYFMGSDEDHDLYKEDLYYEYFDNEEGKGFRRLHAVKDTDGVIDIGDIVSMEDAKELVVSIDKSTTDNFSEQEFAQLIRERKYQKGSVYKVLRNWEVTYYIPKNAQYTLIDYKHEELRKLEQEKRQTRERIKKLYEKIEDDKAYLRLLKNKQKDIREGKVEI